MTRTKPSTCPDDAWWSEEDQEWIDGQHDAAGLLTGCVRYWTPEGVYLSECEHKEGKPHGPAKRFRSDGSIEQECRYENGRIEGIRKVLQPKDVHSSIVVYECVYLQGDLIGTRYRNAEGIEVDNKGTPVPERPKGVPETATPFQRDGWLYMRRSGEDGAETLEMREYYADGATRTERLPDGMNRRFGRGGELLSEGMRVWHNKKRPEHGLWKYGDESGVLRRESLYEYGREVTRTWYRSATEADGGNVKCTGPVESIDRYDALECDVWEFFDENNNAIDAIDVGDCISDEALLAHPVTSDEASLEDLRAEASGSGAPSRLARIRLFGRCNEEEGIEQAIRPGKEWPRVNRSGETVELGDFNVRLSEVLNTLLFGTSPPLATAELGARLFQLERPQVALDLIDAGLRYGQNAIMEKARIGYLRALGRDKEAETMLRNVSPWHIDDAQEKALLAIRERPDDNALRLAYAQIVEEHTPEHAALIRLECGGGEEPKRSQLVEHLKRSLPDDMYLPEQSERGFYPNTHVSIDAAQFLTHADALFRATPLATQLDLSYASDHIAQLTVMPSLSRYTEISFSDTFLFEGRAAQIARSKHLQGLEHLGLYETSMYDEDLEAITSSTAYPTLMSLDISNRREGQSYSMAGFETLKESAFANTLTCLDFDRRYFDYGVVEVLASLPQLHSMSMEGSSLGDDGTAALTALPRQWTRLGLARCDIGPAGAMALAQSPSMEKLAVLLLSGNALGDEGVTCLLASPHLAQLKVLDFSGGSGDKRVGAALGFAMKDAPLAPSLQELNMSLGNLGEEGCLALASAPLQALSQLNLHNNQVGDAGAAAIASSQSLGSLYFLDLSGNGITDEGALALAESKTLTSLAWLELGGAEVSEDTQEKLRTRFANVHVKYPWNRR